MSSLANCTCTFTVMAHSCTCNTQSLPPHTTCPGLCVCARQSIKRSCLSSPHVAVKKAYIPQEWTMTRPLVQNQNINVQCLIFAGEWHIRYLCGNSR